MPVNDVSDPREGTLMFDGNALATAAPLVVLVFNVGVAKRFRFT